MLSRNCNQVFYIVSVITLVWYTLIIFGIVWIVRWWRKGNTLGGTLIRDEPIPIIPLPRDQPVVNHIQINNLNVNNGSISMIQGRDVEMEVGTPQRVRQRSIPPPELRPFFADDVPDLPPPPPHQDEEEEEEDHHQHHHESLPVIQESVFSSDEEADESSYHPPPPRRANNIRPRHQSTPNATGPAFHTRRRRQ
jgi:hypothetical protein